MFKIKRVFIFMFVDVVKKRAALRQKNGQSTLYVRGLAPGFFGAADLS